MVAKKKKRRSYSRLTGMDRITIENGLDDNMSFRKIAYVLHRPTSTISDEVKRNRTIAKGALRGELVEEVPKAACPQLKEAPWVCNGCKTPDCLLATLEM